MFKIEKNVPHVENRGRKPGKIKAAIEALEGMEAGDSFVYDTAARPARLAEKAREAGIGISMQQTEGGHWRIWRK